MVTNFLESKKKNKRMKERKRALDEVTDDNNIFLRRKEQREIKERAKERREERYVKRWKKRRKKIGKCQKKM